MSAMLKQKLIDIANGFTKYGLWKGGSNLSELDDVTLTNLQTNDVLTYNGSEWVNDDNLQTQINTLNSNLCLIDISQYITIKNGEEDDIYVQIDSIDSLEAPVQERIIIGKIKLFVNDEIKVTINIINDKKVEKMNVIDYYKKLLTNNFENMCEV